VTPRLYPYARANRRIVPRREGVRIIASLAVVAAVSAALPALDVATQGAVARGVAAALAWMGGTL
jgi:hypothetical protein